MRNNAITILTTILLMTLAWAETPQTDKVLATFSGGEIRLGDAKAFVKLVGSKMPPEDTSILESVALTLAWEQEARRLELDKDPKSLDLWQEELAKLSQRVLKAELFEKMTPDPEAIEREIASGQFAGRPEKWRLRQLFKKYPNDADEKQRAAILETLEVLREKVRAGASFAQLAMEHSDSQTKYREGLIGNVIPAELDPRLLAVVEKLEPGGVSDVFKTTEGGMLFYLEKKIPPIVRTLQEQKDLAIQKLTRALFDEKWTAYIGELESQTQIHESVLLGKRSGVAMQAGAASWRVDQVMVRLKRVLDTESPLEPSLTEERNRALRRMAVEGQMVLAAHEILQDPKSSWHETYLWSQRQFWALQVLDREATQAFVLPTDADLRAAFAANSERYQKNAEYQLLTMGWQLTDDTLRQKTALAEKARQEVLQGKRTFAEAAKAYSELPSAQQGGALGWVSRPHVAAMGKHVLAVISSTAPGTYSELVRQEQMLYWFKVEETQPQRPAKFEEVRENIQQRLANEKLAEIQMQLEQAWLEKIEFKRSD